MQSGEEFSFGHPGKPVGDFDIIKITVNLNEAVATVHKSQGKEYPTFGVVGVKKPDNSGKRHTVSCSEEKKAGFNRLPLSWFSLIPRLRKFPIHKKVF